MSVAKNLISGRILEDQLFPPGWAAARSAEQAQNRMDSGIEDYSMEAGVLTDYAERRLTQATGVGRDKILSTKPQLLRDAAGIYHRYTVRTER